MVSFLSFATLRTALTLKPVFSDLHWGRSLIEFLLGGFELLVPGFFNSPHEFHSLTLLLFFDLKVRSFFFSLPTVKLFRHPLLHEFSLPLAARVRRSGRPTLRSVGSGPHDSRPRESQWYLRLRRWTR